MSTSTTSNSLVYTVKNRCRVCYTCVRECPVKAIKIINGQAEVLTDRCIGCGNCVNVCSQGAKAYKNSKSSVLSLLRSQKKVAAALAPSFPAEYEHIEDHKELVGMIRELGFDYVLEVAFGADLVAEKYKKLIEDNGGKKYISSDCPAIVNYIEKYHPKSIPHLAPISSPMVAITRLIKKKYGEDVKVVFIGPCFAKKEESEEVDEALTFAELTELFNSEKIWDKKITPSDFDPPYSGKGAIFPVSRGLMQTINVSDDICEGNILVAEGRQDFMDAITEFENGLNKTHHLELLCCKGCIMGPGMTKGGKRYARRTKIGNYVYRKMNEIDIDEWKESVAEFRKLDLSQSFSEKPISIDKPKEEKIKEALAKMGKHKPEDHLNCGACGYQTCYEHSKAIVEGIAESEMCLPYTIEKLHNSVDNLNASNEKLANAREALQQSEKLANMGQLSAGIAHELNNPLGVITMYSNILKEEAAEDDPIREDLDLIVEQANRCKSIVGGLLNFARKNQVNRSKTNLKEFLKHSIASVIKPENVDVEISGELKNPYLSIDQDQMMQVLTNLEKNAFEAMSEGGTLKLKLSEDGDIVKINVCDTGVGIPKENMDKLFTPFFTTKSLGKGTGLGLSLIYGIVKMHKGKITVHSNAVSENGPTGTCFEIQLPRNYNL
jgi:two-component system NtrC family sensor kinase